jgi:hypothetical protein
MLDSGQPDYIHGEAAGVELRYLINEATKNPGVPNYFESSIKAYCRK